MGELESPKGGAIDGLREDFKWVPEEFQEVSGGFKWLFWCSMKLK